MGVKERIYLFAKSEHLPIKRFEQMCGMSNGYVSSMRKGMGADKLENVLRAFPNLNRDWLLYGEGEMIKTSQNEQYVGDISGSYVVEVNLNGTNIRVNADRMDSFHSLVETVKDMQRTLEALREDMEILIKHCKNDE